MLLKIDTLACIKRNEVSLASRRWRRPTVKSDGRLRTTGGELRIDEVPPVTSRAITNVDAAAELDCEWDRLKPNVRKLKNLELTISHETWYSLSVRGRAVLAQPKATGPA